MSRRTSGLSGCETRQTVGPLRAESKTTDERKPVSQLQECEMQALAETPSTTPQLPSLVKYSARTQQQSALARLAKLEKFPPQKPNHEIYGKRCPSTSKST
jgi:hypothetical protein